MYIYAYVYTYIYLVYTHAFPQSLRHAIWKWNISYYLKK